MLNCKPVSRPTERRHWATQQWIIVARTRFGCLKSRKLNLTFCGACKGSIGLSDPLTWAVGQWGSSPAEARSPPKTGQVFGVGGHCRGAWLVGWSEALDGALGARWADRTGGANRRLVRGRVCFGGSQCAAVQMQIYSREEKAHI